GKTRTLTEEWDRSPHALVWSPDGKTLLVTAEEHGRMKVFAVDVASGRPKELLGDHFNRSLAVTSASPSAGERILVGQDSLTGPTEIWSARNDGSDLRRLTHINDDRITLAQVSMPDEFWFAGVRGDRVHAWILKPVPFGSGRQYPVAVIIHGGPQGAICDEFHNRWNLQAFAGAGYAVLAVNFHGSTGFGQRFTDSISGDWDTSFDDVMKGLDHALTACPWMNPDRVGALGASFGGWMINWINGHTNRFKCLVNHAGVFDVPSFYYMTEELWFPEWELGGVPWEKAELYQKFSPMAHVANWQTPTLVIHGARDYRCIDAGGIAAFTALQRRRIPSQLLYFPDEGHWILNRKNSIVWYDTVIGWLNRWLSD
ncbi:MAG TPA: S9 family peptidase, partial [Candidatus Acidoferrales bacterium]|nr:S9 family peptidase [Candidatus Acidoferrales bacterium]